MLQPARQARSAWRTAKHQLTRIPAFPAAHAWANARLAQSAWKSREKEVANSEGKDLWVMAELEKGEPVGVTYELLGEVSELAAKCGQRCCAVLVAAEAGDIPQKLIAAGADVVYTVTGAEYAEYNTNLYTNAFCELAEAYNHAQK